MLSKAPAHSAQLATSTSFPLCLSLHVLQRVALLLVFCLPAVSTSLTKLMYSLRFKASSCLSTIINSVLAYND